MVELNRSVGKGGEMRSAWRWHRKSIITLEDVVFKGRRLCRRCGEKFLQRKAGEGGGSEPAKVGPEMVGTPRKAGEEAASAEVYVGDSEPDYPVG